MWPCCPDRGLACPLLSVGVGTAGGSGNSRAELGSGPVNVTQGLSLSLRISASSGMQRANGPTLTGGDKAGDVHRV